MTNKRIKSNIKKAYNYLAGIVYPDRCAICSNILAKGERGICKKCCGKVSYIKKPACMICGKQLYDEPDWVCPDCRKVKHSFERGVGIFVYDDLMRKSIQNFKYHNHRENGKFYGREIAQRCKILIEKWQPDALIPVPIHKKRYLKRGYNQSEVISKYVSEYTGVATRNDILFRVKKTKPQKNLSRFERMQNLKDSFWADASKIEKINTVILIDDIYTTGSTIENCAKTLKEAGVKKIYFICLSIGV